MIGAGGIIRSDKGIWGNDFMKFIGSGNAKLLEAQSLYLGLKIEIEMDCHQILNLNLEKDNPSHPLHALISNCRQLLSNFEGYKLAKIFRNQNTCADILAKEGRRSRCPQRDHDPFTISLSIYFLVFTVSLQVRIFLASTWLAGLQTR